MKKWIIALVIIVGASLLYGVYQYTKGPRQINKEKTEIQIDANGLLAAFENNEAAVNEQYLDKIIEVSGTVLETTSSETKNIILETTNPMSTIVCELGDESVNVKLNKGDKVIVKGQCTGYLMDVVLVKCLIVKNK